MTSGHFLVAMASRKFVKHQQEMKTHLSTSRETGPSCAPCSCLALHRDIGGVAIGGTVDMQLKYLFSYNLFSYSMKMRAWQKKVREKSRECHNHRPQPFQDIKRKRKPTNPNKHKSIKRTKSTKISSLFPKRGNRNAKRTEKLKLKRKSLRSGEDK